MCIFCIIKLKLKLCLKNKFCFLPAGGQQCWRAAAEELGRNNRCHVRSYIKRWEMLRICSTLLLSWRFRNLLILGASGHSEVCAICKHWKERGWSLMIKCCVCDIWWVAATLVKCGAPTSPNVNSEVYICFTIALMRETSWKAFFFSLESLSRGHKVGDGGFCKTTAKWIRLF